MLAFEQHIYGMQTTGQTEKEILQMECLFSNGILQMECLFSDGSLFFFLSFFESKLISYANATSKR